MRSPERSSARAAQALRVIWDRIDLPWWADFSGHRMVTAGEIVDENPDKLVADAVATIQRAAAQGGSTMTKPDELNINIKPEDWAAFEAWLRKLIREVVFETVTRLENPPGEKGNDS